MFLPFNEQGVADIARYLKLGEVAALPTETVYGLAANVFDQKAVRKIFEIKGRPFVDPLIVHVLTLREASELAYLPPELNALTCFWPGPLTVVLQKTKKTPELVTGGRSTVAIRVPAHSAMRRVLQVSGLSLAAPSANPFGYISPTRAEHVADSLGERVSYILDAGPCPIGIESTIVDLTHPKKPQLLRLGPISVEQLEACLKRSVEVVTHGNRRAPGMRDSHYSPRTPLVLVSGVMPRGSGAFVYLKRPSLAEQGNPSTFWLSEEGDLSEIAQQLFHMLQVLDRKGYETIYIETPKAHGLGLAIYDRLSRAAHFHCDL